MGCCAIKIYNFFNNEVTFCYALCVYSMENQFC